MTPAARVSAAIELLERILAGAPAEKVLTTWARANRYAGSGDRAAIRDHVFDALRCKRSYACLGGAATGRGLMIGAIRASGNDPNTLFTGEKYAPAPLDDQELVAPDLTDAPEAVRLDCPDWLLPEFQASLGDDAPAILDALRHRAPIFLRANLLKTTRDAAAEALAQEGITTRPHPLAETALEVTENPRRIANSAAYQQGLVEFQDAASQAVVAHLPLHDGQSVLDYCAGGGGKTLAIAAQARVSLTAHDARPERLRDLPKRAERAGVSVEIATDQQLQNRQFDLVLCDVPCSGSGAWRRSPDAKWALTPTALKDLVQAQTDILDIAKNHTKPNGCLAYITCSLFSRENHEQVQAFLARHPGWMVSMQHQLTPLSGGDGFFVAIFKRVEIN